MDYIYSSAKETVHPEELANLWVAAGWGKHEDYPAVQMEEMLRRTDYVVSAKVGEQLVACARVFSDGFIHTMIADIVVHPKHRRQGLGRALMEIIKKDFGHTSIYLDAFEMNTEFFRACGYEEKGMMKVFSKRFSPITPKSF